MSGPKIAAWCHRIVSLIGILIGAIAFTLSLFTEVNASTWKREIPNATLLGQGEFTWWGLSIYTAKLWQSNLVSSNNTDAMRKRFDDRSSFALELTYHKSISRSRFVDASIDEIKRIHPQRYADDKLQIWRQLMEHAFIDVSSGDQLIGVYLPDFGCRFYNKQKLLAEIPDKEFAVAFFSIWLDPKSKDEKLRKQLLGQNP